MSLKRDWEDLLFKQVSASPVALVRIGVGLVVIFAALQLFPERFIWFSDHGLVPSKLAESFDQMYTPGPRPIDLLLNAPDWQINVFFLVYMVAAVLMTAGVWTRAAAFVVWIGLNTIHNRDAVNNTTGYDQMMVVMVAYLIMARSDAAFSVSRLLRVKQGKEGRQAPLMAVWPQRVMQLQVAIVYLTTFLTKCGGKKWQDGTAVYYPYWVDEFHRFAVPWMDGNHMWFINFVSYSTLLIELALGTLIFVPKARNYVLFFGILLHVGIEYSMNVPLFGGVMIASYAAFLNQGDMDKVARWVKKTFDWRIPNAVDLISGTPATEVAEPELAAAGKAKSKKKR